MRLIRKIVEALRRPVPPDDLSDLCILPSWPAARPGECPCCGHEWQAGEMIGAISQAYERNPVRRSPGVRVVCALCDARQAIEGDFSLTWAREAGLL